MYWILFALLFTKPSCDEDIKTQYTKYNLTISEIDCGSNETVMSFKNVFISNTNGLFEYDFRLKTRSVASGNSIISSSTTEDSVSLSFIPNGVPVYYQFDFKGNLLKKDSVKYKSNDFIKIDAANKTTDPLYTVIENLAEKDLTDTIFNELTLQTYKHPKVLKDSMGEMTLQLFFSKDTLLKTPFNVNNRYPKPFDKYNLVGIAFTNLGANRKMIAMISDIRAITTEEISLCDMILKKIIKSN